jgi:hypothetical protein
MEGNGEGLRWGGEGEGGGRAFVLQNRAACCNVKLKRLLFMWRMTEEVRVPDLHENKR